MIALITVAIVGVLGTVAGIGAALVARKYSEKQRCPVCSLEFQHGDHVRYDPQEKATTHYNCVMLPRSRK